MNQRAYGYVNTYGSRRIWGRRYKTDGGIRVIFRMESRGCLSGACVIRRGGIRIVPDCKKESG